MQTARAAITEALESTKAAAKDPVAIKAILEAASDRAMLKNVAPGARAAALGACEPRVRRRRLHSGPLKGARLPSGRFGGRRPRSSHQHAHPTRCRRPL
jgi:hypothetical protein